MGMVSKLGAGPAPKESRIGDAQVLMETSLADRADDDPAVRHDQINAHVREADGVVLSMVVPSRRCDRR